MGLDMNLYKKTYVRNWEFMKPEERVEIIIKTDNKYKNHIKPERISEIVEEVAYWRKFNALHHWFVENCQNGKDECQESYVEREKLEELLGILKKIKKKHSLAEELLPSQSGFFFGGTEYDEWYYKDIEETADMLEKLLAEKDSGEYYYRASW